MRIVIPTLLILVATLNYPKTMGLDILLVSKDRGENQIYYTELSRSFCNFLCGSDAYENAEFEQLQQLTGLDLSLFRKYPVNFEPNIDELEYKLYVAEEENNSTKIEELKKEIKKVQEDWEKNYDTINEGWTKVDDLKVLTEKLISKLTAAPKIHEKLEYNFNWGDYFENKMNASKKDPSYTNNTLLDDLNSLLKGLKIMTNKGVIYVAFNYG